MNGERRWRAVWALLVVSSGLYFLSQNEADNDLWVHVRVGLDVLDHGIPFHDTYSYTAAGGPWIDHEWLLHALFGSVWRSAGGPGLLILKLIVAAATFAVVARAAARRCDSIHAWGATMVVTAAVLARGFAVRPQSLSYLGIALLWTFLDRERRRDSAWRWWLVPAIALWLNVHGGVLLGVAMTGLCAAWILPARPRDGIALGVAAIAGVLVGLLLNPYGFAYAGYVVRELGSPHPITEWQSVSLEAAHLPFFALGLLLFAALPMLRDWRERGWQAVLAVGLLFAAMFQQRHTPVFALCAAPVVAEGLSRLLGALSWRLSSAAQSILLASMAALAAIQLAFTVLRLGGDRMQIVYAPEDYPVAAVLRLRVAGAEGNLALPLEWGGYALWHLAPRIKVSLDGRFATVYPHHIVEENFDFFAGGPRWQRLLEAHPTDAVLAPSASPPPIATLAGWRKVYGDPVATLYAREGSAIAAAVRDDGAPLNPVPPVFP